MICQGCCALISRGSGEGDEQPYHSYLWGLTRVTPHSPLAVFGALGMKGIQIVDYFLEHKHPSCWSDYSSERQLMKYIKQLVLECIIFKEKQGIWLHLTWILWHQKNRWVGQSSWCWGLCICAIFGSGVFLCASRTSWSQQNILTIPLVQGYPKDHALEQAKVSPLWSASVAYTKGSFSLEECAWIKTAPWAEPACSEAKQGIHFKTATFPQLTTDTDTAWCLASSICARGVVHGWWGNLCDWICDFQLLPQTRIGLKYTLSKV